jgi:ERF superfamily
MEVQATTAQKPKKPASKGKAVSKAGQGTAVAIHQPPAPTNMLQVIAQAVMDPRCDTEKMKALLDMQERIEARDAEKAFTKAFNDLQAELPIINRDGKIDHGDGTNAQGKKKLKTSFATYPNLNRVCGPLMKKFGFTFSTSMEPEPTGTMVAVSTLAHIAGASRKTHFRLTADTTGAKNNQQGWGSSQQYGMRYNMIALLNIVTEAREDADNDGNPLPAGPISQDQLKELIALADEGGADKRAFCALFDVDGMANIPADKFEEAKKQLQRKVNAKRKQATSDFPGDK